MVELAGADHRVCFVNPAFCLLVGRTREELMAKRFAEIVSNGDKCVPLLDRVYQTGEPATLLEPGGTESEPAHWLYAMWPALDADEQSARVVVQLTKSPFSRQDEIARNEALVIGALRQHELREAADKANARLADEIIHRKQASIALHEAVERLQIAKGDIEKTSRAKDDFLAALSHELRTPLTPVLFAVEALLEDDRLPADVREQIAGMERNIVLETRLIDDLLDVTRIVKGKLELRLQPADAHALIGEAIAIVHPEARAKGMIIERSLHAQRSRLDVDPARFQQVIWNLLRNAVKFTPPGGKVSIRTQDKISEGGAAWLRIEISDTGMGLAPGQLERIFLAFEQGEPTGGHRFGGLGLGLTIARSVVELHGGTINAHSAGANRGATFVVELPGAALPSAQSVNSARTPVAETPPLRLLVVEDDPSTLKILSRLLERRGHRVVAASTAAAALAAAAGETFDVVISDVGLPDGSGLELMQQLHESRGLRGIALSGYGMEDDIAKSRAVGFDVHLVKPVQFAQLTAALASFARK